MTIPKGISLIPFPCGGWMDTVHILKAFERGADGVVVLVCHNDNCRYLQGYKHAELKVSALKQLLDDSGISPERLILGHLAAVEPVKFAEIVTKAFEGITMLGPAIVREA
jgi:coenzyme F420-reducing hydrogenase delta subunit